MRHSLKALSTVALIALSTSATAAETKIVTYNSAETLRAGELDHVSLTAESRLVIAPEHARRAILDDAAVWAVVAHGEVLFAATGSDGRVYRIEPGTGDDISASVVLDADEPEIHALAVDPDGTVWAASSPDGRVYRLRPGAAPEVFVDVLDRWIWSIASDGNGTIYLATGDPARVYRVGTDHLATTLLETKEQHILSLLLARNGTLWAGSGGGGYLYHISGGAARVVLDAAGSEVNALAEDPNGTIYLASSGAPMNAAAASVAALAAAGGEVSLGGIEVEGELVTSADTGASTTRPGSPPPSPVMITAPPTLGQSSIERIERDGSPQQLWSGSGEIVHALLWSERLLVATGQEGRLLALDSLGRSSIVLDLSSSAITALAAVGTGVALGTSDRASLWLMSDVASKASSYLTPVVDAGHFATWGRVTIEHEGEVAVSTRSGNTRSPEDHWSPWHRSTGDVKSPSARFLQVKVELKPKAAVRAIEVAYLPRNLPPRIRSIEVLAPNLALVSDAPAVSAATALKLRRVGPTAPTPPSQPREEALTGARSLRWVAEDPNQDALRYTIQYRGDGEVEWKPLGKDLVDSFHTFDSTALPDGRYELRVTASDDQANAAKPGLTAELTSERILIDHTAPVVALTATSDGASVHLGATVTDRASAIRWADIAIDGGPWQPILPDDLVLDEREERFSHQLDGLSEGEHTAVLRAEDAGGNQGAGKAVWRSSH